MDADCARLLGEVNLKPVATPKASKPIAATA
jgi:hypothetical protein